MRGVLWSTLGILIGLGACICLAAIVFAVVGAFAVTPWLLVLIPFAAFGMAAGVKGLSWAFDNSTD